jgi:PAS domain S-box-containing protein/diguanylate cyclase (GGDEF)-like protein
MATEEPESQAPGGAAGADDSRRLLELIMDTIPAAVHVKDRRLRYRMVNRYFLDLWGLSREQVVGRTQAEVFRDRDAAVDRRDAGVFDTGRPTPFYEVVWTGRDGRPLNLWAVKVPLFDDRRRVTHVVTIALDIGDRKEAEARLVSSERLKSAIVAMAQDAIVSVDDRGEIIDFNPAAERIFRLSEAEAKGRPAADFVPSLSVSRRLDGPNLGETRMTPRIEDVGMRADGEVFAVELTRASVDIDGRQVTAAYLRDITERKAYEQRLETVAYFDPLTGLANRALLLERLDRAIRSNRSVTAAFLGLKRLGAIKKSLGHDFADRVLTALAARLTAIGGIGETVARLGPQDFGAILEASADADVVERTVSAIRRATLAPIVIDGREIALTMDVGLASVDAEIRSSAELIRDAEVAADHAEGAGPCRYAVFMPSMRRRAQYLQEIEVELRHALDADDQIGAAYQPIVDLRTESLIGFEALIRWRHPSRGQVAPDEFVPIAEQTGLIVPLGLAVLRRACRQVREWTRDARRPLFVSVNLSPRQLADAGLAESVQRSLAEAGVAASSVKLEITESATMDQIDSTLPALHRLKSIGVGLSIDDFGTGHSSLSYLQRLPIDCLKIDRSFVVSLPTDERNREMVRLIAELARVLRLQVVAEGIESGEELGVLKSLGCEAGQGYWFGRPLEARATTELVRGRRPWTER